MNNNEYHNEKINDDNKQNNIQEKKEKNHIIEEQKSSILNKKLTRREFIKKSIIGLGAITLGSYAIKDLILNQSFTGTDKTIKNTKPTTNWKWQKQAYYFQGSPNKAINCKLCPQSCYLTPGDRGFCRTRVNIDGKLYTYSYGNPVSINIDPIEKKPLYHFLPGTKAFSLSTAGCNLRCLFCQNADISQHKPEDLRHYDLFPKQTVAAVESEKFKDNKVKTIAYTYGEPVAYYDYMLDTSKLAQKSNIKNAVITAGYINKAPLNELMKYVDTIKIDLKGFNDQVYRKLTSSELQPTLETIKQINKKVWLEIVNLVVPTQNDNLEEIKQMSEWVKSLNKDIPLHFSRFDPQYKLQHLPPTPMQTLQKAYDIAKEVGLNYVYIGNVPHGDYENTYCPKCGKIAIERHGYIIKQMNIKDGKCTECNQPIAGIF